MIEIQDFEGKTLKDIIDLILEQESNSFKIYFPKSTALNFSEREAIAFDYNKLAYSGHLLNKVSKKFSYEKVPPEFHESVLFTLETNDLEGLSKALFEISFGYVNDCEDDIYHDLDLEVDCEFDMNADQYLADVVSKKIIPVCKYFCEVALEFFKEEEEI